MKAAAVGMNIMASTTPALQASEISLTPMRLNMELLTIFQIF